MFKFIVFSMTQMYDIFHYFLLDGLRIYCVARRGYFTQVQVTCQVEPMGANAFFGRCIFWFETQTGFFVCAAVALVIGAGHGCALSVFINDYKRM